MVADEKDEIAPDAPADESLPTEAKKEPKKRTMLLAVILAVILVVAAIGVVIGLGLLGGEDNEPPSGGAWALTGTTIDIGGSVSFESLMEDEDGEITNYFWEFGDGGSDEGAELNRTSHTYAYGGSYLVYHEAEDDDGDTGNNEAQMISVTVMLWSPGSWDNETDPFAILVADQAIVEEGTEVEFNMTGCAAQEWYLEEDPDTLETWDAWDVSWEYIESITLDFGDGSDTVSVTPAEYMSETHTYASTGTYAAKVTVTSQYDTSTTAMYTVRVLTPEATYEGVVKNPDAFVTVSIGEPQNLDPAIDYESAGGEVLQNCYETLIWYDGDSTVDLIPMLATEVPTVANGGISADGMNYTFNLREGVTFHDGTEMTAEDVEYSIERALRIHDPTGPAWMIEAVMTSSLSFAIDEDEGTTVGDWAADESVPQWLLDGAGLVETDVLSEEDNQAVAEFMVSQVDDMTVNFRLVRPYPAFLKICAYTLMSVVSKDFVEANGGIVNGESNEVMLEEVCGTGPYMLPDDGWEHGTKIHLVRNDDYWGEPPALKDVYLITATDQNTRILMLQAGDADSINLNIAYESMFADDPDYRIVKGLPTLGMTFAGFNMDINVTAAETYGSDVPADFFTDPNIRAAFVRLFDGDVFIQNVLKGNALQPNGPIPKGLFGYDESVPTYPYDLEAAEAYLKLALNTETTDPDDTYWDTGFSIALFYNAGNTYRETACMYMKEALDDLTAAAADDTGAVFEGVVQTLDWPQYVTERDNVPSAFPVFYLAWAPDYADPDNYVTPFLHSVYGTFTHSTGYVNTTLDGLIDDAAAELDTDIRADLYYEISMAAYYDAPYLWLWQANNFHIERSWVNGYYYNQMYSGFYYPQFSKG